VLGECLKQASKRGAVPQSISRLFNQPIRHAKNIDIQHITPIQAISVRYDTQKKATRRWRFISFLAVFSG